MTATLNAETYAATVTRIVKREKSAAILDRDYVALVAHFDLTAATESEVVTEVARKILLDGAALDGTKTGASLTVDDLKGRRPEAANILLYWKAARAIRQGLVRNIPAADDTDEGNDLAVLLKLTADGKAASDDDLRAALELILAARA